MNDEQMNQAMSEACGWSHMGEVWWPPGLHPLNNIHGHTLPNYLNDLNACHGAFLTCISPNPTFLSRYEYKLATLVLEYTPSLALNDPCITLRQAAFIANATPRQHVIAMLTAIGKLEGTK